MAITKFRATKKVNGKQVEKWFPVGTADSVVALWKERTESQLGKGVTRAGHGTFAADVATYLDTIIDTPKLWKERAQQLDWWSLRFGRMHRSAIEGPMVLTELAALRTTLAASTVNKYRFALQALWTTLDGAKAPRPTDDVTPYDEPDPEPRNLSPHVVWLVFNAWSDLGEARRGQRRSRVNIAKTVLRVILRTGLAPEDMRRLRPEDFKHLGAGMIYARRREKGKGVVGAMMPLTAEGVAALAAFREAGLIGRPFSSRSIYHGWDRTRQRILKRTDLDAATRQELERSRPYDLRHTFGTFALERTQNLKVTSELMRHRSTKTTKRYVGAQVLPYLQAAVNLLGPGIPTTGDEASAGSSPEPAGSTQPTLSGRGE